MIRIMCVYDRRDILFPRQFFNGLQNNELILKIQVGFRLIQNQHIRMDRQRPRDQNHLQFSTAHFGTDLIF